MKKFHFGLGPFIKSNNKTSKIMTNLLIALIPIIIFSFYKNGIIPYSHNKVTLLGLFYPLIFILVGAMSSTIIELLYHYFFMNKKGDKLIETISNSYAFFPGLFLALILPINTPIYILIFGCLIAVVIGKMLYGGFGNNIFNPALIGCLFIMVSYSSLISSNGGYLNNYELDGIASATPLSKVVEGLGTYDTVIKPYGNLWNFFIGTIPGAIGETSFLLCIIAYIYLAFTKTIKWKIPLVYITTVFVITYFIGNLNNLGIWYPLFQIMSGGLAFGAVFMATDPVTSPTTGIGQILFGIFLGILTVTFRFLTPYPEGVMTSILTMNMLVFIIDKVGARARFNFNHALVAFVVSWALILGLGFYIGSSYQKDETSIDPNFNIIDKVISGNKVTYTVTQKGFSGLIKAEIVINDGDIMNINILSQSDSYFQKITNSDYLSRLIEEQNNLNEVEGVSGATISSNAVRKMVINTISDYQGNKNEK